MTQSVISPLRKIAEHVNCSEATLRRWIKDEGFPAFKKDEVWRVLSEDVLEWFRHQRDKSRMHT